AAVWRKVSREKGWRHFELLDHFLVRKVPDDYLLLLCVLTGKVLSVWRPTQELAWTLRLSKNFPGPGFVFQHFSRVPEEGFVVRRPYHLGVSIWDGRRRRQHLSRARIPKKKTIEAFETDDGARNHVCNKIGSKSNLGLWCRKL